MAMITDAGTVAFRTLSFSALMEASGRAMTIDALTLSTFMGAEAGAMAGFTIIFLSAMFTVTPFATSFADFGSAASYLERGGIGGELTTGTHFHAMILKQT